MFLSYPILAALLGMLIAQGIKIPIYYVFERKWKWELFFSTGGMPSSHTATVIATTTAFALTEGFFSNIFALSVVFSAIVIHDATGVRRHAGYHAEALNKLTSDFNNLVSILKHPNFKERDTQNKLKELLGHKPKEVFFGFLLGIGIGVGLYFIYPF